MLSKSPPQAGCAAVQGAANSSGQCLSSLLNVNLSSLESLNVFEILWQSISHPFLFLLSSHPFPVKLLHLCKEEIKRSKDIRKLRSSIGV